MTIRVRDASLPQPYRFGAATADFLLCLRCGGYLGALLTEGERVARRKRAWAPATIVDGGG